MTLPAFKDLIFYEIYPNSFFDSNGDGFGDLKGIESKLPYVKGLGFNAIWLNPIYDSPFLDGGYDVRNPFLVSARYGNNEDFEHLLAKAHEMGMRIFLDLVPGHMSVQCPDFLASAEGIKNDKWDLFVWNDNPWDTSAPYRWISGYFNRHGCFMVNFFAHQPAINYGFREVKYPWQQSYKKAQKGRKYLESIMKFWLDKGVDGFRVDMADSLVKGDEDKEATIWLWKEIKKDLAAEGYTDFFMTSEWSNPDRSLRAGFTSDFVLDHWNNFSHKLFREREVESKQPLLHAFDENLWKLFKEDLLWRMEAAKREKGYLSIISGNHDTWRIADYLTPEELRLAYFFLLTMPGVPYIYFGDELGLKTNHDLVSFEGGYQRTGSRTPMRWDGSKNAGFSTAEKIFLPSNEGEATVEESEKDPNSLLCLIRKLNQIRKEEEDLRGNDFELLENPLSYRRGSLRIYINLKDEPLSIKGKVLFAIGKPEAKGDLVILKKHEAVLVRD